MVKLAPLLLVVCACHAHNPEFCLDGVDGDGECIVDPRCFGAAPYQFCVTTLPTTPQAPTRIDTTGGCDELIMLGRELCLVAGTDVTISQRVVVTGMRPVVVLASGTLTIEPTGILDATGSTVLGGPGADIACDKTATNGTSMMMHGGGGAGGSFGTRGGGGGAGGGGQGGMPGQAIPAPLSLQGGCSGTDGGDGMPAGTKGTHGFAGGGVYLVAGAELAIMGVVNASGAGGLKGKASRGGGGGGGSGGMIVLYAPMVTVTAAAQIFANGGGGGGGAKDNAAGTDGAAPSGPLSAASGGGGAAAAGAGGDGGAGGFFSTGPQPGMSSGEAGGGGGGSVGVIQVLSGNISAAQVSPRPT